MALLHRVLANEYRDSVALMQLSSALARLEGVKQASAVMATPSNLELLARAGLNAGAVEARPSDLLIVVEGDAKALPAALDEAQKRLAAPAGGASAAGPQRLAPRSIAMALAENPQANLALISTPGDYATAEALKALNLGLHVMLFSDNVSGADEAMLKRRARELGLIVMGPDCGTAIVNGIPLAFANVVKRGAIGSVAASGTGLQEVTVLVDRYGAGISQAIGTGGHDLSKEVGGISMLSGLAALAADPATKVIVLVSKPPAKEIAESILAEARRAKKPVVVNFLGSDPAAISGGNLRGVETLEDAARTAVGLLPKIALPVEAKKSRPPKTAKFKSGQQFIRGLFSGGTFCYEATLLLQRALGEVWSNSPVGKAKKIPDAWKSRGHTLVDLGEDEFTRGRPHPMIDHRLRNERLLVEAADPEVAVVLLDVVLGYGSHADPAAEMVPVLEKAQAIAKKGKRNLAVVGHVCGTDADPQGYVRQSAALAAAGMLLASSNAEAARWAAKLAKGAAR